MPVRVPGALSIALRPAFATWLGWLTEPDQQIVVLRNPDQDPDEIVFQAAKIGHDHVDVELLGGISAWSAAGLPVSTAALAGPDRIGDRRLLDVRQASEYAAGHVPGALHIELGDLAPRLHRLPSGAVAVMCGHGERATTAASILQRAGRHDVLAVVGDPDDWAAGRGGRPETGR